MGLPILSDDKGLHITDPRPTMIAATYLTKDHPHIRMDDILFTQPGIEKLLLNIKPSKAAGPDKLPARVLKEVGREISAVLAFIFQQSYEEGLCSR